MPIFALEVATPGIVATWIAYLIYGAVVRLPGDARALRA